MEGAARTVDEGEKLLTLFEEKANTQRDKLKQVQADLLSFRAAAAEFGLLAEYARLFPDAKGKAPEKPALELKHPAVPVPGPAAKTDHLFHGLNVDELSKPNVMYAAPAQLQIEPDPSVFGQDYSNAEFTTMLGEANLDFALHGANSMNLDNDNNAKNSHFMWQWENPPLDDDPFSMVNEDAYPLGPIL